MDDDDNSEVGDPRLTVQGDAIMEIDSEGNELV
jgi:hypothetical protein